MKTTLKYLALTSVLGLSSQWALADDTDFVSLNSCDTQAVLSGDEEPINDLHLVLISDEEQLPEADHSDEHADADDTADHEEATPTIEEEQPADDQEEDHVDADDMRMQDSDNIE